MDLEIENFLTVDEQNEIYGVLNMTPHTEKVVLKVIREVNQKVLNESEQKGIEKGKLDIAKNMVEKGFSMDEIVEITGLTVDEIIS